MVTLYLELPEVRREATFVPLIFLSITSLGTILKIITCISDSPRMRNLDKIAFFEIEKEKPPADPLYSKTKEKREVGYILSLGIFFVMVWLIGFLPSVFIYAFLFIYQTSRKIKRAIFISLSLVAVTYIFSLVLPGGLWRGLLLGG